MSNQEREFIDVDKSWDGKGSLDEHRQKMFKEIPQPGFGKEKPKAKQAAAPVQPQHEEVTDNG